MKKLSLYIIIALFSLNLQAQDAQGLFNIPIKNWNMQVIGLNHFYPIYLADPLDVRFEVSARDMKYSDVDLNDNVNVDGTYKGRLVINPGVKISLFRFSPKSNPKLGLDISLGVSIPAFMRSGNHDLIGLDGIYYFAISGKPYEWLSLRFSKHHICTHIGDEFPTIGVRSPIDFDPNVMQLPVRDDMILSAAVRPLYFLGKPRWDILQIYGDFGFFLPGSDFLGERQNKPNRTAYLNLQGGIELEYYFKNPYLGGVFAAGNVSSYQANAFSPNISLISGYLFPQDRFQKRLRIGVQYYNGRSLTNQFYNRKEIFTAFIVAIDI
ncbi:MAG TPA: hypothetical protein DCQ58_08870 [Saprospirales bacterium]|nr:hypothetical protein [Saprospirales bacterium]